MGQLNILSGNMFDYLEGKDLIVNSANKYMTYGSGICGQIYKRAGKNLLEEYCKEHFPDYMAINEARITPGFNLNIDILHIYVPKYYESYAPISDLYDSYLMILNMADENEYKDVISVSVGTGVHGYKHEIHGPMVSKFLKENISKYNVNFTLVVPNEALKYYE